MWILSFAVITSCISEVYTFGFRGFYHHPYNTKRQVTSLICINGKTAADFHRNKVQVLFATSGDGVYIGETKNYRPHGFGNKTWNNGNYYVGEFNNGLRTGHGILTTADESYKYDGDWLNDLPYGNGILQLPEATYTGQFEKGTMHGNGTLQLPEGTYTGQFENGTMHGNGQFNDSNGGFYNGHWKNGAMDGYGKFIANASLLEYDDFGLGSLTANGFTYEGQFKNGTMHGNGTFKSDGFLYIGNYENGLPRGYGFLNMSLPDGASYIGETLDGDLSGNGTLIYQTSDGQWEKYSGHIYNDSKNGFGELQFADGRVYAGQWLDDVQHGLGEIKFSNQSHYLSYSGEFVNGRANGFGTTVDEGTVFIGYHVNGLPNGLGNANFSDGRFYKGLFKNGLPNGNGTLIYNSEQYDGEFLNGVKSGYGVIKYSDKMYYAGQWLKDKKHGNGTEVTDLEIYIGEFKFGNKDGFGQSNYTNGDVYTGEWKNGLKFGNGIYVASFGTYMGEFKYDYFDGLGKIIFEDGSVYEGEFKDDLANGDGTIVYGKPPGNVTIYTGQWINSKKNGYGTLTVNGVYGYEGEWKNDLRHGCGISFSNNVSEQLLWRNDVVIGTKCRQKVDLRQISDGRIYGGEFGDKGLNGTGLFFFPGQFFLHGQFADGEFLHGIKYHINGNVIFSSFNQSKPIGNGYKTNTNNFKTECMNWDLEEVTSCGSDMQLKRYENYETYYGQLRNDKRHGYGEFKERRSCNEGICHYGRWRKDKPHGFGIRQEPFQNTLIGQFKDGLLDGSGISLSLSQEHNTVYFGGWKNGKNEGVGVFIYPDGEMVIGIYKEGRITRVFDTPTPIFIDTVGNQQEF